MLGELRKRCITVSVLTDTVTVILLYAAALGFISAVRLADNRVIYCAVWAAAGFAVSAGYVNGLLKKHLSAGWSAALSVLISLPTGFLICPFVISRWLRPGIFLFFAGRGLEKREPEELEQLCGELEDYSFRFYSLPEEERRHPYRMKIKNVGLYGCNSYGEVVRLYARADSLLTGDIYIN